MQLRFATGGAAEGWARVRVETSPYLLGTEESVLHDMEHDSTTVARFVVVEDGKVLGIGRVRRRDDAVPSVMVQVHPDHQQRGVGRLLFDRLRGVVPTSPLTALVDGDERSRAVAAHWGFVSEREGWISSVDPREAPAPPVTPAGLRVVPLAEVGPEAIWACHNATAADDPSGLTRPVSLEHYLATDWTGPLHRPDLGTAVLEGGTVVAYTQVDAADDRAWSSMTGTRASHRGRGLATLVKAHALAAMAVAGITRASTGNDRANAPMLAVNERLGYRPSFTTWTMRRPAETGG